MVTNNRKGLHKQQYLDNCERKDEDETLQFMLTAHDPPFSVLSIPAKATTGGIVINKPKGWGKRHVVVILSSLGSMLAYMMRLNLSLAIVGMVKAKPTESLTERNSSMNASAELCFYPEDEDESHDVKTSDDKGEFEWSESDKGIVLSAFFWGYVALQCPGGMISSRFGGKWLFCSGILLSGVMTLLTPTAARLNFGMLLYCRILQGLSQSAMFPSLLQLLAGWIPPNERSFLSSFPLAGCNIGAALSMITTGYLVSSSYGWPSVFYFTGSLAIVWFIVWVAVISETPKQDNCISEEECNYLVQAIGIRDHPETASDIPWKKIFTSWPVWLLAITELCSSWGAYTIYLELPSYLKIVLKYDMEKSGWLSASPYLAMWASECVIAYIADFCIARKFAKPLTVRKICHVTAEVGAGLCLIAVSYTGCNRIWAVVILTFAAGVAGGVCVSIIPNLMEIGWNYAGMVMGITNTVGNFAGFLVPIVTGVLLEDHVTDQHHWRYIFYLAAGLYILGAILFVCFATSEEQSWNKLDEDEVTITEEETVGVESSAITLSRCSSRPNRRGSTGL